MPGQIDVDGLVPVKPTDPPVIAIGKFAVEEYKKKQPIEIVAVVSGFTGSGDGGNYYLLIIETQDSNGAIFLHKALVFKDTNGGLKVKGYWGFN